MERRWISLSVLAVLIALLAIDVYTGPLTGQPGGITGQPLATGTQAVAYPAGQGMPHTPTLLTAGFLSPLPSGLRQVGPLTWQSRTPVNAPGLVVTIQGVRPGQYWLPPTWLVYWYHGWPHLGWVAHSWLFWVTGSYPWSTRGGPAIVYWPPKQDGVVLNQIVHARLTHETAYESTVGQILHATGHKAWGPDFNPWQPALLLTGRNVQGQYDVVAVNLATGAKVHWTLRTVPRAATLGTRVAIP